MIVPLAFLIAAKLPVVAWLPAITKDMALYDGEPAKDRDTIAYYAYPWLRSPLKDRFDTPDILKWQAAMATAGVGAVVNGDPAPPAASSYNLAKCLTAARSVGADFLAATWITKAQRWGGGDNTNVRLDGTLTVIDVKAGKFVVNARTLFQAVSVAGPYPQVVDARGPARQIAIAFQRDASIRIKHYLATGKA